MLVKLKTSEIIYETLLFIKPPTEEVQILTLCKHIRGVDLTLCKHIRELSKVENLNFNLLITRVLQIVLSLIGFLSFIPGFF